MCHRTLRAHTTPARDVGQRTHATLLTRATQPPLTCRRVLEYETQRTVDPHYLTTGRPGDVPRLPGRTTPHALQGPRPHAHVTRASQHSCPPTLHTLATQLPADPPTCIGYETQRQLTLATSQGKAGRRPTIAQPRHPRTTTLSEACVRLDTPLGPHAASHAHATA